VRFKHNRRLRGFYYLVNLPGHGSCRTFPAFRSAARNPAPAPSRPARKSAFLPLPIYRCTCRTSAPTHRYYHSQKPARRRGTLHNNYGTRCISRCRSTPHRISALYGLPQSDRHLRTRVFHSCSRAPIGNGYAPSKTALFVFKYFQIFQWSGRQLVPVLASHRTIAASGTAALVEKESILCHRSPSHFSISTSALHG